MWLKQSRSRIITNAPRKTGRLLDSQEFAQLFIWCTVADYSVQHTHCQTFLLEKYRDGVSVYMHTTIQVCIDLKNTVHMLTLHLALLIHQHWGIPTDAFWFILRQKTDEMLYVTFENAFYLIEIGPHYVRCKFPDFCKRKNEPSLTPDCILALNDDTVITLFTRKAAHYDFHSGHLDVQKMKSLVRLICLWPDVDVDMSRTAKYSWSYSQLVWYAVKVNSMASA